MTSSSSHFLSSIDRSSLTDNEVEQQVEFTGEVDGDEHEFAVKYAVLTELSGDEPEDDALELFDRFSDETLDACWEAATAMPGASLILLDATDLDNGRMRFAVPDLAWWPLFASTSLLPANN